MGKPSTTRIGSPRTLSGKNTKQREWLGSKGGLGVRERHEVGPANLSMVVLPNSLPGSARVCPGDR